MFLEYHRILAHQDLTKICNIVGSVNSPILANVYLHYALDLWFQKVVIPHCSGEACLIRYADDCAPRRLIEKGGDRAVLYER